MKGRHCREILPQYNFLRQLYVIQATLYTIRTQAVISVQQFILALDYITEQAMAAAQPNPEMSCCPDAQFHLHRCHADRKVNLNSFSSGRTVTDCQLSCCRCAKISLPQRVRTGCTSLELSSTCKPIFCFLSSFFPDRSCLPIPFLCWRR